MSRGLGKQQRAILDLLAAFNEPLVLVDIAASLYSAANPSASEVPPSYYESVRRAASKLVERGLLRVGQPEFPRRFRERARLAYWLPDQKAPELRRKIPASVFECHVMNALKDGATSQSSVVSRVGGFLTRDKYQFDHDRMCARISKAISKFEDEGKVSRFVSANELGQQIVMVRLRQSEARRERKGEV